MNIDFPLLITRNDVWPGVCPLVGTTCTVAKRVCVSSTTTTLPLYGRRALLKPSAVRSSNMRHGSKKVNKWRFRHFETLSEVNAQFSISLTDKWQLKLRCKFREFRRISRPEVEFLAMHIYPGVWESSRTIRIDESPNVVPVSMRDEHASDG